MAFWGKILGGVAGFVVGGPMGAVVGAALGHAAESGAVGGGTRPGAAGGGRDQVFAVAVVAIAAKLAKCDGTVNRAEIDAFKRCFLIPEGAARDIGRWFDTARDSPEGPEPYAQRLAVAFAANPSMLEEVMASLTAIAAADGPINGREAAFLARVRLAMGLGETSLRGPAAEDPYAVLGLSANETDMALRARWRALMREHHPDSLAARGAAPDLVARAQDQVARINAAWDRIKRERGL
jgi:DnaJ like chaperone protein